MLRFLSFFTGNAEYLICLSLFTVSVCFSGIIVNYRILSSPIAGAGIRIGVDQAAFLSFWYAETPVDQSEIGKCVYMDLRWVNAFDRWLFSGWYLWRALLTGTGFILGLYFVRPGRVWETLFRYVAGLAPVMCVLLISLWLMAQNLPNVAEDCWPEPVVLIVGLQPIWWSTVALAGTVAVAGHLLYAKLRVQRAQSRQQHQAAA